MAGMLSRFLPSNATGRSIYEELRAHEDTSSSDIEERAGLHLDEENLRYHDDQLAHTAALVASRITTDSTISPERERGRRIGLGAQASVKGKGPEQRAEDWTPRSPRLLDEDGDDEVPASLLIEDHAPLLEHALSSDPRIGQDHGLSSPTAQRRAPWDGAPAPMRPHDPRETTLSSRASRPGVALPSSNPRDRALWYWVNVTNLDRFIGEVYDYYTGAGIWCILLGRTIGLLKLIFVAVFTTFLTQCVTWSKIPHSAALSQVLVKQCTKNFSGMANVAIWLLALFVLYRAFQLLADIPRLLRIQNFYQHLLHIPDGDMQTITWQEVVAKVMVLRDANPITVERISPASRKYVLGSQSKERLDAHDICNRLMRKENYLIALFNKDILDLTIPLPFLHGRQMFSRMLGWNLQYCILDYIFNETGQVRQLVLQEKKRRQLSDGLRTRFWFAGLMNVICAPVIVIYLLIVYFLRYFNEYYKNPASLGSRAYTPLAEWKFREFNELHHLFHQRINMSYPFASRYLEQFPKIKTVQATRFIAFIAGAIVSVLVVATVWDPEVFLGFEITPERTALFYLGVFGPLWAIMNASIPDENLVFDPEYALRNVIEYTHYQPDHWTDRLHSNEVKMEFASLYKLKILIFLEEILSIIITPFLLWFSLPKCSDAIIDFFREFTVHVDGVGYVCSFAVFDFKHGVGRTKKIQGATGNAVVAADPRDEYFSTKHGKMAASYYGFLDNYMLNPKTGVPGHMPPGSRNAPAPQFHPPPSFPGMMSPTLAADMKNSRAPPSERRRANRAAPNTSIHAARTPRFPPAMLASPMPSILLDPHHQPSTSGFGARSSGQGRRESRSRYQARTDIMEEDGEGEEEAPAEDDVPATGRTGTLPSTLKKSMPSDPSSLESTMGLGESKWETSPTRDDERASSPEKEGDLDAGKGVLGLLYQFQKAQTEGRPRVI